MFVLTYLGSSYYLGFFANAYHGIGSPSLYLTNTKEWNVSYSIEASGVGYSYSGIITPSGSAVVSLPISVICDSYDDQHMGIYLQSNSSDIIVIGQNMNSRNGDTFLALPNVNLCNTEYIYFGISMPSSYYPSIILIVGTEDNTRMNLTVTQSVYVKVNDTRIYLISGQQYSFIINRLQTVYIESLSDLTGTKIATEKPVSVFSGNECAYIPSGSYPKSKCEQLVEQIPATMYWGKVHYTAPLAISTYHTLKILAAYDSTTISVYCDNVLRSQSVINEGKFATLQQQKGYCAIHSTKEILLAQISHAHGYYRSVYQRYSRYRQVYEYTDDDPMLTIVPATVHYNSEIKLSTIELSSYTNYMNIIVVAEYYQPDMIYWTASGVHKTLQSWSPIKYNDEVEAYSATISVPKGAVKVAHTNISVVASMAVVVYGAHGAPTYGHSSGFNILKYFPGMLIVRTYIPSEAIFQRVELWLYLACIKMFVLTLYFCAVLVFNVCCCF